MIKIRRGTFETNSSSMHSLVLKNSSGMCSDEEVEKEFIKKLKNVNGKLYLPIDPERFDHGFDLVTDSYEKFLYFIAGVRQIRDIKKIRDALKNRFSKIDPVIAEKFTGFIFKDDSEYDEENNLNYEYDTENNLSEIHSLVVKDYEVFFDTGEIDHQSADLPAEAIHSVNTDSVKALEEIIFSDKYFFVIESDGDAGYIPNAIAGGMYDINTFKAMLRTFYPSHKEADEKTGKIISRTDYSHSFPYWSDITDIMKHYDSDDDDD